MCSVLEYTLVVSVYEVQPMNQNKEQNTNSIYEYDLLGYIFAIHLENGC